MSITLCPLELVFVDQKPVIVINMDHYYYRKLDERVGLVVEMRPPTSTVRLV